jgi:type IV secretory pathway VirB10-like protein
MLSNDQIVRGFEPGYAFNVMVTQDLVFPGPYDDSVRP